jgi:hypothetical protein
VTLDEARLAEAKEARDRLLDLQHQADRARLDYHHVIRRLHAAGGSLREIADALGLSHQRVHQIVDEGGERDVLHVLPPPPFLPGAPGGRMLHRRLRGPRFFEHFGAGTREVIAKAQEEARALGHDYVGTEHLLLGLLGAASGRVAEALGSLGVTLEGVRREVVERVGEGGGALGPGEPMAFTGRAKRVVEAAFREALAAGSDEIAPEHLLLALASRKGVAAEVLAALGADAERLCGVLKPSEP